MCQAKSSWLPAVTPVQCTVLWSLHDISLARPKLMLFRTDLNTMQTLEGRLAGSHTLVEQGHQCLSEAYLQQAQASSTSDVSSHYETALHHKRKAVAAMLLHYGLMCTQVGFEQIQMANMLQAASAVNEGAVNLLAEAEQQRTRAKSIFELHYGAAGIRVALLLQCSSETC